MASESREDGVGTVEIPADLEEWLQDHAAHLGIDRGELAVRLLDSYRAAANLDDAVTGELFEEDPGTVVEHVVGTDIEERVDAAAADAVDERAEAATEHAAEALRDEVAETVEAEVTSDLEARIDAAIDDRIGTVESEFQSKIEDVRERVVQVKREADAKAPADHEHEALADLIDELDRLEAALDDQREAIADRLDDAEADLAELAADLDAEREGRESAIADLDARLSDAEDKLKRVAWVVSDLRDDVGGRDATQRAVDRIKRAAAQEGVSSATCENCGETVQIALLTQPECPHCNTTVSDVRPESGLFRKKARLVAAAQLESGANVP